MRRGWHKGPYLTHAHCFSPLAPSFPPTDGVAAATRCADELYQLVPFGHQDTNAGVDAAGRALCSLAIGETEAEATRNPSTSAPRHPGHVSAALQLAAVQLSLPLRLTGDTV